MKPIFVINTGPKPAIMLEPDALVHVGLVKNKHNTTFRDWFRFEFNRRVEFLFAIGSLDLQACKSDIMFGDVASSVDGAQIFISIDIHVFNKL